jgi:hypothetical protein
MPAGGPPPARQDVVSQRSGTLCPPGSDRRSGLAVHRRPANGQAPGDQAHCARPRTTSRSMPAIHRRPANDQSRVPGAGGGGEARSRGRSHSTWSVASQGGVSIPAAVSARLSPKDTRFSEQTRASNQYPKNQDVFRQYLDKI